MQDHLDGLQYRLTATEILADLDLKLVGNRVS